MMNTHSDNFQFNTLYQSHLTHACRCIFQMLLLLAIITGSNNYTLVWEIDPYQVYYSVHDNNNARITAPEALKRGILKVPLPRKEKKNRIIVNKKKIESSFGQLFAALHTYLFAILLYTLILQIILTTYMCVYCMCTLFRDEKEIYISRNKRGKREREGFHR